MRTSLLLLLLLRWAWALLAAVVVAGNSSKTFPLAHVFDFKVLVFSLSPPPPLPKHVLLLLLCSKCTYLLLSSSHDVFTPLRQAS